MARTQQRSLSTSTRPSASIQPSSSSTKPYAHLAPYISHIPQSRIAKTWRPLPPTAQDRIRSLLLSVKNETKARRRKAQFTRVNKNVLRDALSDEDWEACVDNVVDKLVARLPRMPFPQKYSSSRSKQTAGEVTRSTASGGGREVDIDFSLEALLNRNAQARAKVTTNMHSIKLLKAQMKREERALKRDQAELRGLEDGVRRAREVGARQARNLHPIARGMDSTDVEGLRGGADGTRRDGKWNLEAGSADEEVDMMDALIPTQARRRTSTGKMVLTQQSLEDDPDLAPLVSQLRSHMGSMRGNVESLRGVSEALANAEDAVRAFDVKVMRV